MRINPEAKIPTTLLILTESVQSQNIIVLYLKARKFLNLDFVHVLLSLLSSFH